MRTIDIPDLLKKWAEEGDGSLLDEELDVLIDYYLNTTAYN